MQSDDFDQMHTYETITTIKLTNICITPKSFFMATCNTSFLSLPFPAYHHTTIDLLSITRLLCILRILCKWNTQCVFFFVWLILFRVLVLRCMHAAAFSFSLLSSIQLYGYITICPFSHRCSFELFPSWTIAIKVLWIVLFNSLCRYVSSCCFQWNE